MKLKPFTKVSSLNEHASFFFFLLYNKRNNISYLELIYVIFKFIKI
jgi:hypothetical protein